MSNRDIYIMNQCNDKIDKMEKRVEELVKRKQDLEYDCGNLKNKIEILEDQVKEWKSKYQSALNTLDDQVKEWKNKYYDLLDAQEALKTKVEEPWDVQLMLKGNFVARLHLPNEASARYMAEQMLIRRIYLKLIDFDGFQYNSHYITKHNPEEFCHEKDETKEIPTLTRDLKIKWVKE